MFGFDLHFSIEDVIYIEREIDREREREREKKKKNAAWLSLSQRQSWRCS